jgi:hypothetical protein
MPKCYYILTGPLSRTPIYVYWLHVGRWELKQDEIVIRVFPFYAGFALRAQMGNDGYLRGEAYNVPVRDDRCTLSDNDAGPATSWSLYYDDALLCVFDYVRD